MIYANYGAKATASPKSQEKRVSRDTVYKYRDKEDFSPEPPIKKVRPSKLDPYKPLINQRIDDPGLKRGFAQRGLRSRSAIVQAACDEYFANHIYRGLDGRLHDRDVASTNAYPEGIEDKSSVWSDCSYH